MSKGRVKRVISMVIAIAILGTCCVFADTDTNESLRAAVATTYYHPNGGSCSTTYTTNNVGDTYGSLPVPTRSGYVFTGWFLNAQDETTEVTSNTVVTAGIHHLYAHWGNSQTLFNYGTQSYLKLNGSGLTSLYNAINVVGWAYTGTNEQKWLLPDSSLNCFYIRSVIDRDFGLNAYRSGSPWNCNIRRVIGNETDAQIYATTGYSTDSVAGLLFYLKNYKTSKNYVLTIGGSSNGSNAYWTTRSTSNNNQIWP